MEITCQWCPEDAERVPLAMFPEHVHLMHSEEATVIAVESHGGSDLDELKAAYMHLCAAQAQHDRSKYSTGREYKIVNEKLDFLIEDLATLIITAERFQQ